MTERLVRIVAGVALTVTGLSLPAGETAADDAKGTLVHKATIVTVKYAYLIQGPDAVDPKTTIRQLILSAKDLGAKLRACQTMNCASGAVTEGMTVDFDAGPRLNVWMAINDGRVQHSDTQRPDVLKATHNDPKRIAGKLAFDAAKTGGPKVDVEFDAALLKEFKTAR